MWRFLRSLKDRRAQTEEPPGPVDRREEPRVAARHRLSVGFNLSVLDPRSSLGGETSAPMLEGHTFDVSATGAALFVPALSLAGRDIPKVGQACLVEIELPTGPLRFQAAAARHERVDAEGIEGYILGVRIMGISEGNRERLARFLQEARRGQQTDSQSTNTYPSR